MLKELKIDEVIIILFTISIFIHFTVTIICGIFYTIYLLYTKQVRKIINNYKYNYLLFVATALSIIISIVHDNILGMMIAIYMGIIFLIALHYKEHVTEKLFYLLINLITIMSIFVAVIGILQYFYILIETNFVFEIHDEPSLRVTSVFGNANYYANIIEFIVIVSFFKLLIAKRYYFSKYYYLLILALNLVMLVLTGTRTTWGALVVSFPAMFFSNKEYRKTYFLLFMEIFSVYVFIFQFQFFPRLDSFVKYFFDRVEIWITGLKGWLLHPLFGQGPHTYVKIYEEVGGPSTYHAHSLYIDPLLSFGIIGFALFIIFIYFAMRDFFKNNYHNPLFPLSLGIIMSVLIHGIFDISIMSPQVAPLCIFLIIIPPIESKIKTKELSVD